MVNIEPFHVEQWMDKYEVTPGVLNIAETCVASVSIQDLLNLSQDEASIYSVLSPSRKLTYGAILGSESVRRRIAALYDAGPKSESASLPYENVLVTPGAIMANFMLFYTLVGPGDHVVCVYPTYQQLYSVPRSLGAEVSLWRLSKGHGYVPDVQELTGLIKENTKMIVINNPNNPTGVPIPRRVLEEIVDLARRKNIIVFSDEVYRPLFHSLPDGAEPPPSLLSMGYDRTVVTGSMSKAWSLAGIRLGWVASPDRGLVEAMATARDYTTISVSQVDDQVATFAMSESVRPALLERNLALARQNLTLMDHFIGKFSSVCSWVKPQAGTTAFVRFSKDGKPVDDVALCIDVLENVNVMFVPGSKCFGTESEGEFRGFVRIGYVCETQVLEAALARLGGYIEKNLIGNNARAR